MTAGVRRPEARPTRQLQGRDSGATLVETALVFPMVIILIFGIAEFGLAFKDWLSIGHASRQGGRIGATVGNDVQADFWILEGVREALTASSMDDVATISIRNPDSPFETTNYSWSPGGSCDWSPCPDVGDPTYVEPNYKPVSRSVAAQNLGRIEVVVTFTHQWITGLFADTTTWSNSTIMKLEPRVFGS